MSLMGLYLLDTAAHIMIMSEVKHQNPDIVQNVVHCAVFWDTALCKQFNTASSHQTLALNPSKMHRGHCRVAANCRPEEVGG